MLNKQTGEIIGDLGPDFMIEPNAKWRGTAMWEMACAAAEDAFYAASRKPGHFPLSAWKFDDDHILVQVYPENRATGQEPRLAIIFHAKLHGEDHYKPVIFKLPPQTVAALKLAGLLTGKTVH